MLRQRKTCRTATAGGLVAGEKRPAGGPGGPAVAAGGERWLQVAAMDRKVVAVAASEREEIQSQRLDQFPESLQSRESCHAGWQSCLAEFW